MTHPRSVSRRQVLAGTAATLLAGLRPAAAQQSVLRVSLTPSIFPGLFEQLIAGFEAAHPGVKVKVEGSYRDQGDQFQATLRQGLVNDLQDVTFQGFAYLAMLRERGLSVPLDQRLAREPNAAARGLSGAVTATAMVEGELHGLGVGMSFPIIYVNADLARRAGYDPDDLPRDWDGILALARRIGDLGGTSQGGFFQYASGGNWTWIALVETLGGSMMTPDGRLGFTSREGLRSLEIIRAFGEVGQARYDVGQDPARTVFASGVLGVLVDSGSSLATFEKAAEGRFEVRTLPLPAASPRTRVPAAGIATVMHARDPRRQDLAWAFMTHASGPAGQTLVGRLTGYIPANQVPIEAAELLGDYYRQRPAYAAGIASAARVGPWFAFPGANTVKVSLDIRDHLRDVVTLKRTPAEGLAAIERSVRALVPGVRS